MRLRQEAPMIYERLSILMEGTIDDLAHHSEFCDFVLESYDIIRKIEGDQTLCKISKEDIVRCIGVKRTNANDLSSVGRKGGVALYPTYPLMNHHCYCNTRYAIKYKYKICKFF